MNTGLSSGCRLAGEVAGHIGEDFPVEVMVAPPFPFLNAISNTLAESDVVLGAQDVYFEETGAFTGEVSVAMLQDVGCRYIIVGHSERRHVIGETDGLINKKLLNCMNYKMNVVFCVGEKLEEREAGQTEEVLNRQMTVGLNSVPAAKIDLVTLAYEPVWAIGTGKTATPQIAESTHQFLRVWMNEHYSAELADSVRILYGGSVKPENANELMSCENIDGCLVGGASLNANSFLAIVDAAVELSRE